MTQTLIFDGHNDILTRLLQAGGVEAAGRIADAGRGAIDMDGASRGGFAGGFFAMWVPSPFNASDRMAKMQGETYDMPLPQLVAFGEATEVVDTEFAILRRLEALGHLTVCTDVAALRAVFGSGRLAAIAHVEGAEAIGPDLTELDDLYARGVRSLGPVWSRETIFGHGVPFRFPSTPDIGPGLTDAGLSLVRRCDDLGVMLDLSHLNEAGFWDVARTSGRPLVASHSNAHAVSPHARNLTDEQLSAVAASGGLVGVNFACAFLRDDGRMRADTPLTQVIRHMDHLIEHLGEDGVALGSDYDGALVPTELKTVADLPKLVAAMEQAGYGQPLIDKICHGNWFRVLERSWAPKG